MQFDYKTKTFSFGKRDYNHTGRRINKVTITARLDKDDDGKLRFAAEGEVWNSRQTDIITGGQIVDEIGDFFPALLHNPTYLKLRSIWEHCHLRYLDSVEPEWAEKAMALFA